MSSTLVETVEARPLHQHRKTHSEGPIAPPQWFPAPPRLLVPISLEERLAAQLFHLASQHHASEYNRLKFGPNGSPTAYVPLSVQVPQHVNKLRARQARLAEQRAWWPCEDSRSSISEQTLTEEKDFASLTESKPSIPQVVSSSTTVDLQVELSAAMDAPLPEVQPPSPRSAVHPPVKTSDTHPINISMIIPPGLLSIISAHLVQTPRPSPTIFDIPPSYSLERITEYPIPSPRLPQTASENPAISQNTHAAQFRLTAETRVEFPFLSTQSPFSMALRAAMDCKFPGVGKRGSLSNARSLSLSLTAVQSPYGKKQLTKSSSVLSSRATFKHIQPLVSNLTSKEKVVPVYTGSVLQCDSVCETHVPPPPSPILQYPKPSTFNIGNLFLSSCPGKKVRLNGPVKGRGAVCRDLGRDLRRVKEMGVGCVVCCLDDEELDLLGASWADYSRIAKEVGLDVLRIPTPEGMAPLTPELLNSYLTELINVYTLRGVPILVHCRGGVGRAGLVACCWMLKLGLCGWIETDPRCYAPRGFSASGEIRRDTMQLVERVIAVVRRRRSIKAVETYEQVKFIVDFVEYLRECSKPGDSDDMKVDLGTDVVV